MSSYSKGAGVFPSFRG